MTNNSSRKELDIRDYDVLIVGAGPAGLAAANELADSLSVVIVDSGKPLGQRDRYNEAEATQGVGGAGLFSDGKFSFYPSATQLWQLPNKVLLRESYEKVRNLINPYGITVPPLPAATQPETPGTGDKNDWTLKPYPSFYMSPNDRYDLIKSLGQRGKFLLSTTVEQCNFAPELGKFSVLLANASERYKIFAKYLVLAGGRFCPATFPLTTNMEFKRLEVGCRIEQSADESFLGGLRQLDPKLKLASNEGLLEWRTFCACRQGETILTQTQGLWTVSGRADCPPTGRSNVGFNLRIRDPYAALEGWQHIKQAFTRPDNYFNVPLSEVLNLGSAAHSHLKDIYGTNLLDNLLTGIRLLEKSFPSLASGSTHLIGPTLEGVNVYPTLDNNLQIPGMPAWVAGDSTGKFRGIVAALISGHYVAKQILKMKKYNRA